MDPKELDSVQLTEAVDGWPCGTRGAVVDVPAEGWVTVEIRNDLVDEDADLLDALVDVPVSAVRVVARYPQPA